MRRLICCLLAVLLLSCQTIVFSENMPRGAEAYRFDLKASLQPDLFPGKYREKARGYADLLDSLRFTGIIKPGGGDIDLRLTVIPNGNKAAAIDFGISGDSEFYNISSSLFGEAVMVFHKLVLMEFALKIYNHMNVPLNYVCLLLPFAWERTLSPFADVWRSEIGENPVPGVIPGEKWRQLAEQWRSMDKYQLDKFSSSIGITSGNDDLIRDIFESIPDVMEQAFSDGVNVQAADGKEKWTYGDNVLFERNTAADSEKWRLALPKLLDGRVSVTASGNSKTTEDGSDSKTVFRVEDEKEGLLLDLDLDAQKLPDGFSANADFSVTLRLSGRLFPRISCKANVRLTREGDVSLTLDWDPEEKNEKKGIASVKGTVVPVAFGDEPDFAADEQTWRRFDICFLNDNRLAELIHEIMEPVVKKLIPFLAEIPVSACQCVMDTLTDTGFLKVIVEQ